MTSSENAAASGFRLRPRAPDEHQPRLAFALAGLMRLGLHGRRRSGSSVWEHGLPVVLHRDDDPSHCICLVEGSVQRADVALAVVAHAQRRRTVRCPPSAAAGDPLRRGVRTVARRTIDTVSPWRQRRCVSQPAHGPVPLDREAVARQTDARTGSVPRRPSAPPPCD